MSSNDPTQQLDPTRIREVETYLRRHFEADGAPAMTYRNIARAVLASELVVPTSAVNDLANRFTYEPTRDDGDWYASELRALTGQDTD